MEKLQPPQYLPLKVATIAALPSLLLLDIGIAVLRGWPVRRLDIVVLVGAVLALGFLIVFLVNPRGRTLLHKHGLHLAYVTFSAFVAWLAVEAIVTAYLWYYPIHSTLHVHRREPRLQLRYSIDSALMPGITGDSHYTTNSIGIRGPQFPPRDASYRILCIGGSTTECIYLDDKETWTHLLMERLNQEHQDQNVWVGNIGISGYPTVNHLKFIETSPLMREIDCLVLLVGANDFNQFLRGNLANSKLLTDSGLARIQPLWHRSSILALVRERWRRRITSSLAEDTSGENYQRRRHQRQASAIRDTLPDLEQALREYKTRLQLIIKLSRSKGVRVVFVTQPTLWDKDLSPAARALLWLGDTTDGRYISVEAGRMGIDKYNETLMATCREMDVLCIDTHSMHGQEQYFYDDFHFTEAGARELAKLIANGLREVPDRHVLGKQGN